MRRMILPLMLVAVTVVVGSCEPDSTLVWDGTMRDSAGVVLVENHGMPMWSEGDPWTFSKRLRIGVAEGDSTYMFGSNLDFVVLSDDRVVVADAQYHNVRFFSPEGLHLSTLGREGAGPGEFGGVISLLLGPGDTILAVDGRNQQASRIAPDGRWLGSFSVLPSSGYWIPGWDDDETTGQIASLLWPMTGAAAPANPRLGLVVRRDFYGAFLDTLAHLPIGDFITGEGNARLIHFYRGRPDYDLCDGMTVTGHSDEFRFVWQRPDGTVERIVTLDREPLALTGEDEAVFLGQFNAMMERGGAPQERVATFRSRVRFESTYPAYRRFVCGPAGTLLVQRIRPLRELSEMEYENLTTSDRPPGADEWDVFDREGRYLGVAPPPVSPHRHSFTQDTTGAWLMFGIERGELDVPYVTAWQIEGIRQ